MARRERPTLRLPHVVACALLLVVLAPAVPAAAPACTADSPQAQLVLFRGDLRRFKVECSDADADLAFIEWSWTMGEGGVAESASDASRAWSERVLSFGEPGSHAVEAGGLDAADQRGGVVSWQILVKEPAAEGVQGRGPACAPVRPARGAFPTAVGAGQPRVFEVRCEDPDGDLFRVEWRQDGTQEPGFVSDFGPRGIQNEPATLSFPDLGDHALSAVGVDAQGHRSAPVTWDVQVLQGDVHVEDTGTSQAAPADDAATGWTTVFTVVASGITLVGGALVGLYLKVRAGREGKDGSRAVPVETPPPPPAPRRVEASGGSIGHLSGNQGTVNIYNAPPPARPGVPAGVVARFEDLYHALDEADKHLDGDAAGRDARRARALARDMLKDLEQGARPDADVRGTLADQIEAALANDPSPRIRRGEAALRAAVERLRE